jgi:hypothetical protein
MLIFMKTTATFSSLNIKMHNNVFLKPLAEDVGKGYRIMYCINPGSQKRVVGAITACNTANVYTYLLIWKALIFLRAYTYWEWQVYKTSYSA